MEMTLARNSAILVDGGPGRPAMGVTSVEMMKPSSVKSLASSSSVRSSWIVSTRPASVEVVKAPAAKGGQFGLQVSLTRVLARDVCSCAALARID